MPLLRNMPASVVPPEGLRRRFRELLLASLQTSVLEAAVRADRVELQPGPQIPAHPEQYPA
jgi:hypothetical protein